MNYTVSSSAVRVIDESLRLLAAYHRAGTSWDKVQNQAQKLAQQYRGQAVSTIPVEIQGIAHQASVDAIAFTASIMRMMWQQRDILHDPYSVCVEGLQVAHSQLSGGQRLSIRKIPASMPLYEFAAQGSPSVTLPELSLVAIIGALQIRDFDLNDLTHAPAEIRRA
jgi:hypothetical protein